MSATNVLLQVSKVGKKYGETVVLKDINFTLERGKILGLVGENGAGKSTLMNILFGMNVIAETGGFEGEVYFEGESIKFNSPVEALNAGIGMVHQEFSLIPGFTVAENILLNMEKTKSNFVSKIFGKKLETLNMPLIKSEAEEAIDLLGVSLNPDILVSEIPVGYKQFIEIAREIKRDQVKLLILDEPTAVLTETEADILLESMKRLSDLGVSIIFISHRLREITTVCDTIVVLRDGLVVVEKPVEGIEIRQIAKWMVGRDIETSEDDKKRVIKLEEEDVILKIKNLWVDMPGEQIKDVSLEVQRGEILGIGGLAGQGKLGLPNGVMGIFEAGGEVIFEGEPLPLNNTAQILKRGISFVSEDRRGVGLLLDEPIDWNIAFNAMQVQNRFIKKYFGGLFSLRDERAMREHANKHIEQLEIRCTSEKQLARNLSGGNQQKVCLAKAFITNPKLLFVSEPTRGIDVGAKELVLNALRKYNEENNTTIVVVSSELEELRSISDRIAIICEGEIFGIVPPDTDLTEIGLLMSGEYKIDEKGEKIWMR